MDVDPTEKLFEPGCRPNFRDFRGHTNPSHESHNMEKFVAVVLSRTSPERST
jgi:hypothetical protein